MYTRELLQTKSLDVLRAIATQIGLTPHHASKEEKIITEILMVQKPEIKAEEKPVEVAVMNDPDEIRKALKFFTDKGGKVMFTDENWHIKNGIAEDSGHLTVPIPSIVTKAQMLLRARMPARIKIDGEEMLA